MNSAKENDINRSKINRKPEKDPYQTLRKLRTTQGMD